MTLAGRTVLLVGQNFQSAQALKKGCTGGNSNAILANARGVRIFGRAAG